jgi:hypothetical protein
MTLLTEAGPRPAVQPRHRPRFLRLRLLLVLAAVIVVAIGLTTWLVLRSFDNDYGPIGSVSWGGPYSLRGFDTGHGDTLRLSAEPGARGQLFDALRNEGSHSVKVTSVNGDMSIVQLKWSKYHIANGDSIFGVDAPWRDFPATIPAHGMIRLQVTISRPSLCRSMPKHGPGGLFYSGTYQVHWQSLLGSRTSTVQTTYAYDYSVQLC